MSIKENQEQSMARLDGLEKAGITHVQWCHANDKLVCQACIKLANRIFTITEARNITNNLPCTSDPWEQSCRCCWIATRDPKEPKRDPNRKGLLSVVSHVETDKKEGETTIHIVFDLVQNKCDVCERKVAPLFKILSGQFLCEKCLHELRGKSQSTILRKKSLDK